MTIPRELSCSNVLKAIERIDNGGIPHKRRATKFCLVWDGKHYSPKVVVSYSYGAQFGKDLDSRTFHGGGPTNNWLKNCGYEVIDCKCGGGWSNPNL